MHRHLASVLIIALAAASGCGRDAVETVDTSGPLIVRAEPARIETMRASVTVTGTVTPAPGGDWTIVASESGRVVELPKAEGDVVKEGDLLARFEVSSLTAEIIARQSDVLAATARVQSARSSATRLADLLKRGIASQRDSDDAHRELQEAEAALNQALAGKGAVDALAARLVVRARFAGVVAKRWHNPGDLVNATSEDPVLRVIDPTRLEVVANVPLAQLAFVARGSMARIFNPADASIIEGTVVSVPAIAETTATSGDVRMTVPATVALTVGTALQVEITSEDRVGALVIPSSALLRDGVETYVMVAGDDGKAHRVTVMIGLSANERTQIVTGLKAGDKVILAGPEPVADGALITVQRG